MIASHHEDASRARGQRAPILRQLPRRVPYRVVDAASGHNPGIADNAIAETTTTASSATPRPRSTKSPRAVAQYGLVQQAP